MTFPHILAPLGIVHECVLNGICFHVDQTVHNKKY